MAQMAKLEDLPIPTISRHPQSRLWPLLPTRRGPALRSLFKKVNLTREHIVYKGYSVLPLAIRQDTIVAIRKHKRRRRCRESSHNFQWSTRSTKLVLSPPTLPRKLRITNGGLFHLGRLWKHSTTSTSSSITGLLISMLIRNDFLELVWENGQVMMQGRSNRTKKNPSFNSLLSFNISKNRDRDVGNGNVGKTGKFGLVVDSGLDEIPLSVPSSEMGLIEDDDMLPLKAQSGWVVKDHHT